MYNKEVEELIDAALIDGEITEKEKQILFKKAKSFKIDKDEFEMVLDARIAGKKKEFEKNTTSATKSNKLGSIKKCPNCGATLPPLATKCPECDLEFAGAEGNYADKLVADINRIAQYHREKNEVIERQNIEIRQRNAQKSIFRRKEAELEPISSEEMNKDIELAISVFPIPNTKADLFDFITFLQPKIIKKTSSNKKVILYEDKFGATYEQKFNECVLKVRSLYSDDPMFAPILEPLNAKMKADKYKKLIKIGIVVGIIVLLFIMFRPRHYGNYENSSSDRIEQTK